MNIRITNIQKQLHKYGIDGLLITKKKIVNMQQALQVVLASS
ncbi:proline dipeptidase [Bacillus cereus]|nr:proline dipeptidase [Bacillus cereus]